jgi:hypothetical protein
MSSSEQLPNIRPEYLAVNNASKGYDPAYRHDRLDCTLTNNSYLADCLPSISPCTTRLYIHGIRSSTKFKSETRYSFSTRTQQKSSPNQFIFFPLPPFYSNLSVHTNHYVTIPRGPQVLIFSFFSRTSSQVLTTQHAVPWCGRVRCTHYVLSVCPSSDGYDP